MNEGIPGARSSSASKFFSGGPKVTAFQEDDGRGDEIEGGDAGLLIIVAAVAEPPEAEGGRASALCKAR